MSDLPDPRDLVPQDALAAEMAYVWGASWWGARLYRAARAAWRCSRIAARARRDRVEK